MAQLSLSRGCFAKVLESDEKPDNGISNSSIPFFGTAGSASRWGSEEPLGREK